MRLGRKWCAGSPALSRPSVQRTRNICPAAGTRTGRKVPDAVPDERGKCAAASTPGAISCNIPGPCSTGSQAATPARSVAYFGDCRARRNSLLGPAGRGSSPGGRRSGGSGCQNCDGFKGHSSQNPSAYRVHGRGKVFIAHRTATTRKSRRRWWTRWGIPRGESRWRRWRIRTVKLEFVQ